MACCQMALGRGEELFNSSAVPYNFHNYLHLLSQVRICDKMCMYEHFTFKGFQGEKHFNDPSVGSCLQSHKVESRNY